MRTLALLASLVLATVPAVATYHANNSENGVIPTGTGGALAPAVDHARYAIPDGAVGIMPQPTIDPGTAQYGFVGSCPPEMVCVAVLTTVCLAVYAPEGTAAVPYAFTWAYAEADAGILWEDLDPVDPATPHTALGESCQR